MGRPLQKKLMGNPALATRTYPAVTFSSAWLSGQPAIASSTVYILKQTGSNRYLATDGTHTGTVTLVNITLPGVVTAPGQATIVAASFSGGNTCVRSLKNRTVRTFPIGLPSSIGYIPPHLYSWDPFNAATKAGQADIPCNITIGSEKLTYMTAYEKANITGGAVYVNPNKGVTPKTSQIFATAGLTGGAGNASQATANVGGASGIFNPSARQRKAP